MRFLESELGVLGLQEASVDILALFRNDKENEPREGLPVVMPQDVAQYRLAAVDSFNFNLKQDVDIEGRYAGEGAEAHTFMIPNISVRSDFNLPLRIPLIGYVDPVFDLLWDCCKQSIYGTATTMKANVLKVDGNKLEIDNIADFLTCFQNKDIVIFKIVDSEGNISNADFVNANKKTRTLEFVSLPSNPVVVIAYFPRPDYIERTPTFSMLSLREGLISPCLIDKMTIDINQGEPIKVKLDIASIKVFRDKQIVLRKTLYNDLLELDSKRNRVSHIINGSTIRLSPASSSSKAFGLSTSVGDEWFSGYQSLRLPLTVTGLSITIENKLVDVYSLHSIAEDKAVRQRENCFPWAIYSEGRKISGSIKYKTSINPFAVTERLAGPSALVTIKDTENAELVTGGLIVDFGGFQITLPELVWSPSASSSKVSEFQDRTLNWAMVADDKYSAMPELEYISMR